jgi:hypothetical protein
MMLRLEMISRMAASLRNAISHEGACLTLRLNVVSDLASLPFSGFAMAFIASRMHHVESCSGRIGRRRDRSASELTSIQVLDRTIEAVEAVQCLEFSDTILAVPNSDAAADPAALRNDDGLVVRKAIQAFWDARGLLRMDMRVWQPEVNRVLIGGAAYDHVIYTVDGDTYRGRSELQHTARIRPEPDVLTNDVTPMTLLGYGICGVGNNHISRYLHDRGTLSPGPMVTE